MWWPVVLGQGVLLRAAKGLLTQATCLTCLHLIMAGHEVLFYACICMQVSKRSCLLSKVSSATCHVLKSLVKFLFLNCWLVLMSKIIAQETLGGGRLCMRQNSQVIMAMVGFYQS